MKKLLFALVMLLPAMIWAQCPGSFTVTASATAVTCPGNGSITVTPNVSLPANATYQITSGPAGGGYSTSVQNSNQFNALPAGNYTIKASCDAASTIVSITVPNSYTAPTVTPVVSSVCTNYTAGGTITLNSPGSAGPLQYALLLGNDPNAPDGDFTYVSSNVFNVTAWGTYQARVKDGCGVYQTQTVVLQPTYPKAQIVRLDNRFGPNCGMLVGYTVREEGTVNAVNLGTTGYKLKVWGSTTACAGAPGGAPDIDITLTGATTSRNFTIPYSSVSYYWELTSPCGEVSTGCQSLPRPTLSPLVLLKCGGASSPVTIGFRPTMRSLAPFTLTVTGYDAANNITVPAMTVTRDSAIFRNIPAAHHYTYTLQTQCAGISFSGTATTPTTIPFTYNKVLTECTNVLGTSRIILYLNNANVPDLEYMRTQDITLENLSTGAIFTDQVNMNGLGVNIEEGNYMAFNNVPPGNYMLHLKSPRTPGCDTDVPVTITVGGQLAYSLDVATQQACGGMATITATAVTNGTAAKSFRLLNSGGTQVAQNATGIFTNVPAGTYTVVGALGTSNCGPEYTTTRTVTVAAADGAPVVVKKYGITCDGGTATGTAFFEFSGAGPFTVKLKKSTDADVPASWTTHSTAAPNIYSVAGLQAGITYDVFIADNCGKTTTTQVTVQPLTQIGKYTTDSPCPGQPYMLSVEDIPGATYAWTKDGGSTVLSTSPNLSLGTSYAASSDGTYTCMVTIGSCAVRPVSYTISSSNCGSPLYVSFGNISAMLKGGVLQVSWTSLKENNNIRFEIEASSDGTNFHKIGEVKTKAADGNSTESIDYDFSTTAAAATGVMSIAAGVLLLGFAAERRKRNAAMMAVVLVLMGIVACSKEKDANISQQGDLYIRIATVDKDGVKGYSKAIKVVKE